MDECPTPWNPFGGLTPEPAQKAQSELKKNKHHVANIRRQILAVLAMIVVTAGAVALVSISSGTTSAAQPQRQSAPEADP